MPVNGVSGANQFAKVTLETTWGTTPTSGSPTTFWLELENEALTLDPEVIRKDDSASVGNIPTRNIGQKLSLTGSLKTKAFPDLMLNLLPLGFTTQTIGGRTQLPSFTIDYFDGIEARRAQGLRIEELTWDSSTEGQWAMVDIKMRGIGINATPPTLTAPAVTSYPQITPYGHINSSGFITINSVTLAGYKSVKINVKNKLAAEFDEQSVISSLDYCGRRIQWDVAVKNLDTTRKILYESQTAVEGYVKYAITVPSAHSVIFDCQNANYITTRKVDRNIDKSEYEMITLVAFRDPTSGVDNVMTAA